MKISVRLVTKADSELLLAWRNRDGVRTASLSGEMISTEDHDVWFQGLLERRDRGFLIVQVDDEPVGVVRLENLDELQMVARWACHLGTEQVPPGFGAVLPLLGLALGFGRFNLRRMHAEVLSSNKNMRGIHRRLGITEEGVRSEALQQPAGDLLDVHEYGVLRAQWPEIQAVAQRLFPASVSTPLQTVIEALAADVAGQ